MKDLPIRNIFLPATLVGASVFSALAFTLPSFINHHVHDGTPASSTSSQPHLSLTGVHKEIVITYIGTTIVLSAAAGVGTAELLRKRSDHQAQAPDLKTVLAEFIDHHAQQGETAMDEPWSVASANLPLADMAVSAEIADHPPAIAVASAPFATYEFPKEMPEARWPSEAAAAPVPMVATAGSEANDTVMIFPGQYQRCYIQVPGLSDRQYALAFGQHFYRLLSANVSKEQALMAVNQLTEDERSAILTPSDAGYAVWLMEPEAKLISVA